MGGGANGRLEVSRPGRLLSRTLGITWSAVALFLLAASALFAAQPGFDRNDVVRQVREHHSTTRPLDHLAAGLDDGEFLVDTGVYWSPPNGYETSPELASDGNNVLAVWIDERFGVSPSGLSGSIVSRNGSRLATVGFRARPWPACQLAAAVAFGGSNYLVVSLVDPDGSGHAPSLFAERVSPEGAVLDSDAILICSSVYCESPAVCNDGTDYFVVWTGSTFGDVAGARISPSGAILDSVPITISDSADYAYAAVAAGDSGFMVVWGDGDIHAARVSRDGVVLDTTGIPVCTSPGSQGYPTVCFDGSDYLVVWEDDRTNPGDIYCARLDQSGAVLDSSAIAVSISSRIQHYPVAVFDGSNYLTVWENYCHDTFNIYGARVNVLGQLLDTSALCISTNPIGNGNAAAVFNGENTFVAWNDWRSDLYPVIYCARVSPFEGLVDTNGILVSTSANEEVSPTAAFDGNNYLVAWEDHRQGPSNFDIFATRVSQSGAILDARSFPISEAESSQSYPRLAFGGSDYLAVWEDGRNGNPDVYGARVTPAGVVLDTAGIAISAGEYGQCQPAVAAGNAQFLVAWAASLGHDRCEVRCARLTPAGQVLDSAGILVADGAANCGGLSISFDGVNYLVVWDDARQGYSHIFAARVGPAGNVLDSTPIQLSRPADQSQVLASAAFGVSSYLAVWSSFRPPEYYSDILGARLSPAGEVLDPQGFGICAARYDQIFTSIAFDGSNYAVVWEDYRSGSNGDIYGARVSDSARVIGNYPVTVQPYYQTAPAVASDLAGEALVVFSSWTGSVEGRVYNSMRIWGKLGPFGGVAEGEWRAPGRIVPYDGPTILHGILHIPQTPVPGPSVRFALLDISGRSVAELHPGENDVSRVASGVYFVRRTAAREPGSIAKVIIQ
jgi:hypothetical protein